MSTEKSSKLLVILGPTSSGKSALAIDVAKRWNGEIISADSRQVYRGMDIGSGKVPRDHLQSATTTHYISEGIPHHLLDVADPNDDYNISHFLRDARTAIEDIASRDKLPIICGGTGFWIQALIENQTLPNIPPDLALRETLRKLSKEELFEKLQMIDPARAETIDRKNPRRLIRAIEIAHFKEQETRSKEQQKPSPQESHPLPPNSCSLFIAPYSLMILALCPPKGILDAKIRTRLEERLNEGMIQEGERLHGEGVSWERLESFGLEYRWISRFLKQEISEEVMKERLTFDIIHYAKRQITWIRRWQKLGGDIHIANTNKKALEEIRAFLKSH